jgi:hypothetical protein
VAVYHALRYAQVIYLLIRRVRDRGGLGWSLYTGYIGAGDYIFLSTVEG